MDSPPPPSYHRGAARLIAALSAVALGFTGSTAGSVNAEPITPEVPSSISAAPDGSRIAGAVQGSGRLVELTVHSAAMANTVAVQVLPAVDSSAPAPTLYLLNGIDGGADG
ncbi:hypothetical protein IU483_35885, partial [Streptomyces gardneri]|nr:hypothetical protein [Streptomyces gardneri]